MKKSEVRAANAASKPSVQAEQQAPGGGSKTTAFLRVRLCQSSIACTQWSRAHLPRRLIDLNGYNLVVEKSAKSAMADSDLRFGMFEIRATVVCGFD